MTRDEAAQKAAVARSGAGGVDHQLVDQLAALGLLKLEAAKVDPFDVIAGAEVQVYPYGDTVTVPAHMTRYGAGQIVTALERAGFKIVRA